MMPAGTGWNPETTYDANDDLPFRAQLRRGRRTGRTLSFVRDTR
jgi:hypothetical protein